MLVSVTGSRAGNYFRLITNFRLITHNNLFLSFLSFCLKIPPGISLSRSLSRLRLILTRETGEKLSRNGNELIDDEYTNSFHE